MFKSSSYWYKQNCLKFIFRHLFQVTATNIWKSVKKICLVWHSKKYPYSPWKEILLWLPSPVEFLISERGREGWGGRGCLGGMDTLWEYTMLFIYFVCLFIFADSCTWTSWFELVVSWQVARAFFHSSAWWNTTVRSALLSSGHFSNHPIKRSSQAPVQNVSHEDLLK